MSEAQNNDIQARLQQMVEEDPHGKEGERLLRRMVAFHGPFNRNLLNIIAPKEMSRETRMNTFKVLLKWGFLERHLRQPFYASWRPHYPYFLRFECVTGLAVDETIYRMLLLHVESAYISHLNRYNLVYSEAWLRFLFETVRANRRSGVNLLIALPPFRYRYSNKEATETALRLSEHYPDTEQFLSALLHLTTLVEAYNLPGMYEELDSAPIPKPDEQRFHIAIKSLPHFILPGDEDKAFIERTYENLAVERARQYRGVPLLLRLSEIKIKQGNLLEARQHYNLAIRIAQANPRFQNEPLARARIAHALGEIETARFIYSRLYIIDQQVEALWYWGCMEYQQGSQEHGIALCRLSLHEWNLEIENRAHKNEIPIKMRAWQQKRDELRTMEQAASGNASTPC